MDTSSLRDDRMKRQMLRWRRTLNKILQQPPLVETQIVCTSCCPDGQNLSARLTKRAASARAQCLIQMGQLKT